MAEERRRELRRLVVEGRRIPVLEAAAAGFRRPPGVGVMETPVDT